MIEIKELNLLVCYRHFNVEQDIETGYRLPNPTDAHDTNHNDVPNVRAMGKTKDKDSPNMRSL